MPQPAPEFDDALYCTVRRIAAKVAKDLDPEDLTQLVAMRIVRGGLLARWRSEKAPMTAYLYVIARSEAISLRRTAYRRREITTQLRGAALNHEHELLREAIGATVSSAAGSRLRDIARRLSPNGARVLTLLAAGAPRREVRKHVGVRAYTRGWREIMETARAAAHTN